MLPLDAPVVYDQLTKFVSAVPVGTTAIQSNEVGTPIPAHDTVTVPPAATWFGVAVTVAGRMLNPTPLLARLPIVTTTLPEVVGPGTGTVMLVSDQLVGVARVPLNVTVLEPLAAPKFAPVMVTMAPACALDGFTLVTDGGINTVYGRLLLVSPLAVTTTLPVLAPAGTGTTIRVDDQLVGVAALPLKVTVLAPLVEPKFAPLMVTDVPTTPLVGERLVKLGATVTV
jgi:hypothetical protein